MSACHSSAGVGGAAELSRSPRQALFCGKRDAFAVSGGSRQLWRRVSNEAPASGISEAVAAPDLCEETRVVFGGETFGAEEQSEAPLRHKPFEIQLHLKSGHGLLAADRNGLSDPYIVATLGNVKRKSTVIKETLDPVWDEVLTLRGNDENVLRDAKLRLDCYDRARVGWI